MTRGACLLLAAFQTRSFSAIERLYSAWGGGPVVRGGDEEAGKGVRMALEWAKGGGVKRGDGGNLSVTRRASGNERTPGNIYVLHKEPPYVSNPSRTYDATTHAHTTCPKSPL